MSELDLDQIREQEYREDCAYQEAWENEMQTQQYIEALEKENEKLKRQLQIKQYQVDIADESYSIVINERINERLKK